MLFKEGSRKDVGAAAKRQTCGNEWFVSGLMGAHGRHGGGSYLRPPSLQDHSGRAPAPHSGDHHHGLDTLRPRPHHPHCRRHLGNHFLLYD